LVAAVVIVAALVVGVGTASADVMFSDGFESGDFSAWTLAKTGGDGSAVVQSSIVSSGSYAAQLSESSTSGSKAYARKTFATAQQDLTASGDFQVLQQGASGGNVPFFRFFTSGGTRIISLFRQNGNGKIQVGYGGANFATSATLGLNTWVNLQLHVVIAGGASTVEVLKDGTLIYQTTSVGLGTSGVSLVQIGNDTAAQAFTLVADTINVQNGGSLSPPSNTALPTIAGEAQQGQLLSASAGSWSGTQPISYAYQWQRCDTSGANCANVGPATSTYTLTDADVGSTIVVAVTASNSAGSATAPSAATMVVWTSSAVALWHMDETSGNTMFDSAGQNNGTLNSVTLGLPGFSGSAYGFDGSSSYASAPSAASMNPGSANFSFTIVLQTTGTPPPPPVDWDLIRKGDFTTPGGEYKMEFQQSGQASCGFKGSRYAELVAGPALNDGHWHTITCVKTSSDIELIVDGQTFATPATVGSISNSAPVVIGSHPGADWYQGSLDEATIPIGS
jgi:Concanavalin A-like lectin/glucanases superfamily